MIVTIDGPAGVGKSTVAKLLAKRLGYRYLDTGAMYRAFTWGAIKRGIPLNEEGKLLRMIKGSSLRMGPETILLDGEDITRYIRSEDLTRHVHHLADSIPIRSELVRLQMEIAKGGNLVTEGRDQGSVVFPRAKRKFYLDASLRERARRRLKDLGKASKDLRLQEMMVEIRLRDGLDIQRAVGGLRIPKDAIYIDTTDMTVQEVLDTIFGIIKA